MMAELKPCPFCGQKVDYNYDLGLMPIGVYCKNCRIVVRFMGMKKSGKGEVFGDAMKRIAERWNRREGEEGET